jgi:hypothetical protein
LAFLRQTLVKKRDHGAIYHQRGGNARGSNRVIRDYVRGLEGRLRMGHLMLNGKNAKKRSSTVERSIIGSEGTPAM